MNTVLFAAFLALACWDFSIVEGDQQATRRFFVISGIHRRHMGPLAFRMVVRLYCYSPTSCRVVHSKAGRQEKNIDVCGYCHKGAQISNKEDDALVPVTFVTYHNMTASLNAIANNARRDFVTFTLYPVFDTDTFYVMTVPKETKYALLFARDEPTEVTISRNDLRLGLRQFARMVTKDKAFIWQEKYDYKGSLIRAKKPIAVFYGTSTFKGQLPSTQHYGRDFVLFRPHTFGDAEHDTVGKATVYALECGVVTWSNSASKWGELRTSMRCAMDCRSPPFLEFRHDWSALRIHATADVLVLLTYRKKGRHLGDMLSATFPLPFSEYKSEYLIKLPFYASRKLIALIAHQMAVDKIKLNTSPIRPILEKGKRLDVPLAIFGRGIGVWVDVPIQPKRLLHFEVDRDNIDPDSARFAVTFYSTGRAIYVTQVEGYSNYTSNEQDRLYNESIEKIDNCNQLYDGWKSNLMQDDRSRNKGFFVISGVSRRSSDRHPARRPRRFIMSVMLNCVSPNFCQVQRFVGDTYDRPFTICGYCSRRLRFSFRGNEALLPIAFVARNKVTACVEDSDQANEFNAFALYPVLDKDSFFVMAVPEETKYVLLFARDGDTQVTIYVRDETGGLTPSTVTVPKYKGYLWYFKDSAHVEGSVVRANKPIAVFYGIVGLKGQIPSLQHYGHDFIVYRPDRFGPERLRNTFGNASVYAPTCADVAWSDPLVSGGWRKGRMKCALFCSLEITNIWKALRIRSKTGIVVLLTYRKKRDLSDMLSATFVLPVSEYRSDYITYVPFEKNKRLRSRMVFTAIVKEIDNIMLNRADIGPYLEKAKQLNVPGKGSDPPLGVWVDVPIGSQELLHFKSKPHGGMEATRFAVMLYSTDKAIYVKQVEGYSNYTNKQQPYLHHGGVHDNDTIRKIQRCSPLDESAVAMFVQHEEEEERPKKNEIVIGVAVIMTVVIVGATFYAIWKSRQDGSK